MEERSKVLINRNDRITPWFSGDQPNSVSSNSTYTASNNPSIHSGSSRYGGDGDNSEEYRQPGGRNNSQPGGSS